ncbi:Abortive infection protein [Candidatus Koribacter versatilis Ellin345]|uniref:Abortive infection protein n=1 Tax=Koribacter versatilis (strain Ellin345) TaxID=204669 RepID=Q1IPL5_KORVE|nr:CPBP family intramembrane glutamic endopeptidase [Candidatus Koribacter versatilis]ABF41185.1 Abortive infection protein [Candidatus Koribacter versatilis Ellin345]
MFALMIFGGLGPWTGVEIAVALALVALLLAFGFGGDRFVRALSLRSPVAQVAVSTVFVLPYVVLALADGIFQWRWFAVYTLVPIAVAAALALSAKVDTEQKGTVFDYAVLLLLGLAVDLRWFEPAWPNHLHAIGKIVLLDAGLYAFLVIRRLTGTGIDFRARWRDWKIGLRELAYFTPIVLAFGFALSFLHWHSRLPPWWLPLAWLYTAMFIAIPEEIFFRGWMQNLLERRLGRRWSLVVTAIVFGLSHFNKRMPQFNTAFNWRYVLLAAIAGIFYGRAWRQERRVAASAITHASVDTLWSIWLR